MSPEERALIQHMADDAAANGDHVGAADLYALLTANPDDGDPA